MPMPRLQAVVMISLSSDSAGPSADARVLSAAERLAAAGLHATIAVAAPAEWPATATPRARHELALFVPAAATRREFGDALRGQMVRAQARGLEVSTLIATDAQPGEHADLMAGEGITALCPLGEATASPTSTAKRWWSLASTRNPDAPQKLRWGLWQMPPAVTVAGTNAKQLRRTLDRTVSGAGMLHLHVPVTSRGADDACDAVFAQIAAYQREERLQTQTVASVAAALTRPREIVSARSILHKRAA